MQPTPDILPSDAVIVIGAGHFGRRAAVILTRGGGKPVIVIDHDPSRLAGLKDLPVKAILGDGVAFLIANNERLVPETTVVPAVPIHLAFEWLKASIGHQTTVVRAPVPKEVWGRLPHTWNGSEGSVLVSYADFVCPDDCPEPEVCTVSGERREQPLHALLGSLQVEGFQVHIVRSRQLAPGLGGYCLADLLELETRVKIAAGGRWLLGSACKCHGILTACNIRQD